MQDEAGGIAQALGLAELFCKERDCAGASWATTSSAILWSAAGGRASEKPDQAWVALKQVPDPAALRRRRDAGTAGREHRGEAEAAEKRSRRGRHLRLSAGRLQGHQDAEAERAAASWRSRTSTGIYLEQGPSGITACCDGYWTDAGTLESLALANMLVRESPPLY